MKAATSLMNRGLIAHSTDTVATTAVTIAGIAATSENRATKRLCSRAPARAALRAARSLASSIPIRTMRTTTTRPSPTRSISTTFAVGRIGVKPAKTRNVASARTKAAPTAISPNRPVGPLSSKGAGPRAPVVVVVAVKTPQPTSPDFRSRADPTPLQSCNDVAKLRHLAAPSAKARHAAQIQVADSSCAACCG